jgi:hypothetical protein
MLVLVQKKNKAKPEQNSESTENIDSAFAV